MRPGATLAGDGRAVLAIGHARTAVGHTAAVAATVVAALGFGGLACAEAEPRYLEVGLRVDPRCRSSTT